MSNVVSFPGHPLAALIRRTAREIDHTHGADADQLWRERCRSVLGLMQDRGASAEQGKAAVDDFALNVHSELRSLQWAAWHAIHRPGGDAA